MQYSFWWPSPGSTIYTFMLSRRVQSLVSCPTTGPPLLRQLLAAGCSCSSWSALYNVPINYSLYLAPCHRHLLYTHITSLFSRRRCLVDPVKCPRRFALLFARALLPVRSRLLPVIRSCPVPLPSSDFSLYTPDTTHLSAFFRPAFASFSSRSHRRMIATRTHTRDSSRMSRAFSIRLIMFRVQ